ncbi:uncharacterized protein TRIADDRAFT_54629 [Trichoplax adhaerens]|uniref:G-protein coupled receptors family 2 profile 2 domain-containing protein n=1 Tax=Trichoplax adhaerens TaxID=10228 RepID=B3RSK3_TRIAD|nr:hypothetical protein TRIADDRAFT_54629 [Trichoplax adhaerens]EDV27075.1 hypothetical protein TRIADDRAFT_54629 [Trichoplax adhaerens]|eukprot:XP_002111071.1 hypothetical protein TRIADDRAFT_54629 [Trichoplax adhaerens]
MVQHAISIDIKVESTDIHGRYRGCDVPGICKAFGYRDDTSVANIDTASKLKYLNLLLSYKRRYVVLSSELSELDPLEPVTSKNVITMRQASLDSEFESCPCTVAIRRLDNVQLSESNCVLNQYQYICEKRLCPENGWIYRHHRCYKVIQETANYELAMKRCRELYGRLALALTSEIHDTLIELTDRNQTYWLGLTGKRTPACKQDFNWQFKYPIPVKNTSFHAWDQIDIQSPSYSCGALFNETWIAVSCVENLSAFICEQGNQEQIIEMAPYSQITTSSCIIPDSQQADPQPSSYDVPYATPLIDISGMNILINSNPSLTVSSRLLLKSSYTLSAIESSLHVQSSLNYPGDSSIIIMTTIIDSVTAEKTILHPSSLSSLDEESNSTNLQATSSYHAVNLHKINSISTDVNASEENVVQTASNYSTNSVNHQMIDSTSNELFVSITSSTSEAQHDFIVISSIHEQLDQPTTSYAPTMMIKVPSNHVTAPTFTIDQIGDLTPSSVSPTRTENFDLELASTSSSTTSFLSCDENLVTIGNIIRVYLNFWLCYPRYKRKYELRTEFFSLYFLIDTLGSYDTTSVSYTATASSMHQSKKSSSIQRRIEILSTAVQSNVAESLAFSTTDCIENPTSSSCLLYIALIQVKSSSNFISSISSSLTPSVPVQVESSSNFISSTSPTLTSSVSIQGKSSILALSNSIIGMQNSSQSSLPFVAPDQSMSSSISALSISSVISLQSSAEQTAKWPVQSHLTRMDDSSFYNPLHLIRSTSGISSSLLVYNGVKDSYITLTFEKAAEILLTTSTATENKSIFSTAGLAIEANDSHTHFQSIIDSTPTPTSNKIKSILTDMVKKHFIGNQTLAGMNSCCDNDGSSDTPQSNLSNSPDHIKSANGKLLNAVDVFDHQLLHLMMKYQINDFSYADSFQAIKGTTLMSSEMSSNASWLNIGITESPSQNDNVKIMIPTMLLQHQAKVSILCHLYRLKGFSAPVISCVTHPKLRQPFKENIDIITDIKSDTSVYLPICQYWNTSKWLTDGVVMANRNESCITCSTNHLTSFTILMSLREISITPIHERILSIISKFGLAVSIVALSINVAVFTLIRQLRCFRNFIHACLSLALLLADLIFVAGVDSTDKEPLCTIIAMALHYFYLASFMWMLIEAIWLYRNTTRIEKLTSMYGIYSLIGWGIPLLIVAIPAAAYFETYRNPNYCWISHKNGLNIAFIGPIVIIIAINGIILGLAVRSLLTLKLVSDRSNLVKVRKSIRASIVLLPLFGLTWLFGLLFLNSTTLAFGYLFVVINSLQGFLIFIFHCATNHQVKDYFIKRLQIKRNRDGHSQIMPTVIRSIPPKEVKKNRIAPELSDFSKCSG